jgi:UDP-galactopyranose mutase
MTMKSEQERSESSALRNVLEDDRQAELSDVICLSHLRWSFVFQRPQHLMSRFARTRRVFFFEEPVETPGRARLDVKRCPETGVHVMTPHLPPDTGFREAEQMQQELLSEALTAHDIYDYILWYYTPMGLGFSLSLRPLLTVYDCMDELSAFKGAHPRLLEREQELLARADVMFTGGRTLYEAKKNKHHNVHAFPSSVDVRHFNQGREGLADPEDEAAIPRPRFGYCGVIDERMDLELLEGVAAARPEWQLVMIGPVVKIEESALPKRPNIHYLGGKSYQQLPAYIGAWDVAMLPFAKNPATKFISPTKTPEYLAAGRPVISTSIRDVVTPYGDLGLAWIADSVEEFIAAGEACLSGNFGTKNWRNKVDAFLAETSWDSTWSRMNEMVERGIKDRIAVPAGDLASGRAGQNGGLRTQFAG